MTTILIIVLLIVLLGEVAITAIGATAAQVWVAC